MTDLQFVYTTMMGERATDALLNGSPRVAEVNPAVNRFRKLMERADQLRADGVQPRIVIHSSRLAYDILVVQYGASAPRIQSQLGHRDTVHVSELVNRNIGKFDDILIKHNFDGVHIWRS